MANIVIVKTGSRVDVDFGDYWRGSGSPLASNDVNAEEAAYRAKSIARVWKENAFVFVWMEGEVRDWKLGVTQAADNFVIDSVDGVAPTDESHLYSLISALME